MKLNETMLEIAGTKVSAEKIADIITKKYGRSVFGDMECVWDNSICQIENDDFKVKFGIQEKKQIIYEYHDLKENWGDKNIIYIEIYRLCSEDGDEMYCVCIDPRDAIDAYVRHYGYFPGKIENISEDAIVKICI